MNRLITPSIASIRGAFAVLRFDDRGFAQIDGCEDGFRRSWGALILALPFMGLAAMAIARITAAEPKFPDVPMGMAFVGGIFQWVIGAGCFALIALVFNRRDQIRHLLACRNWIALWFLVLEAPFHFLTALNLLPPIGMIGSSLIEVYGLVVMARTLLVVLKLPVAAVIGILVFLLLIQLSLAQVMQGLAA